MDRCLLPLMSKLHNVILTTATSFSQDVLYSYKKITHAGKKQAQGEIQRHISQHSVTIV